MVPTRTLNPVWSPDCKWIAYASRLNSLYHAIFVANVETGEKKQVTDGLADAVWPVWDASGKYLWFLASTDFGLKSQWLDMTSYPYNETFGLYLAVLKKADPSPLLPESDEDKGVGSAPARRSNRRRRRQRRIKAARPARRASPVTVQIDFDGLQQRILAVAGVPAREYSRLKAGVAGTVYYLEASAGGEDRSRCAAADRAARQRSASLSPQRSGAP